MRYVVTSDWHLRSDRPICRLDPDWMDTQRQNVAEVVHIANEHDADILNAGDLFDVPRTPPNVVAMLLQEINRLKGRMHLIGGNHSIQYHKQEFLYESSLGIIAALPSNNKLVYYECEDNSEEGRFEHYAGMDEDVAMIHTLTFKKGTDIMFGMQATTAEQLLERYSGHRFLITGDNHSPFVYEEGGRFVVNPGSLNIQAADAMERKPRVFLIDTKKGEVDQIYLTTFRENITDDHLESKHQRDDRIAAFVETVKTGGKVSLSFEDNLERMLIKNKIDQDVRDIFDELKEGK